ncbi:hypothetical protein ASD74_06150 [Rhizobium sp. Root564]|nr:hypothetical protein ASD74_06150 [Rhizobium sp. Root564]
MVGKPNAAELDMLTDEEREGLLDEDTIDEGLEEEGDGDGDGEGDANTDAGNGTDKEQDKAGDGDGEGEGDGDGDDNTDAAKAAADAAAAAEAAAAAAAAASQDAEQKNVAQEPQERAPSWRIDPAVPDKITELDKQRDEIVAKFDDGEMTGAEMRAQLKPIETEIRQLETKVMAADIAKANAIDQYRDVTIPNFMSAHTEYQPGTILHTMLDAEVRRLQQTATNPLSPKILEQAHTNLSSQVEKAYGVKKAAPKQDTPKPNASGTGRQVPPTLGTVPAADANDADDGGEFAWLDRLANSDVEKYETELAKLSDEKRERYMAE